MDAKQKYHSALRNLEEISDSIHERRNLEMNLLEPRGQGVGAESRDGICLNENDRSEPDAFSISLQVEQEMNLAIKALTLKESKSDLNEEDANIDEDQKSFCEVSLFLTDSDDSNEKDDALLETPPLLPQTSKREMTGKLFVSPPPMEQSEDTKENISGPIRLEKWFFFSSAVDDTTSTTNELLDNT